MASRAVYTVEFLLRLQQSPLVAKPSKLPPIDEWMGPPEARTQQRPAMARPKTDDGGVLFEDGYKSRDKRPGGLDGRSRTSIPEDIVLGPPSTQFASASSSKSNGQFGAFKKAFFEDESGKTYRDKSARERTVSDREGDKSAEARGLNGRRLKEDSEGWTSVKSRRNVGSEEPERTVRPTGDRDKTSGTYKERFPRSFDSQEGNETEKKNGFSRAQDSSWFRSDTKPKEPTNGDVRERNWRDKAPAKSEWSRGAKVDSHEREPEWLEADFEEEKKPAKSMEEFQRWREKMRAANSSTDIPKVEETEKSAPDVQSPPSQMTDQGIVFDSTSDSFFNLWGQNKAAKDVSESSTPLGLPTQPPRGSRFNRFFSSHENTPKTQDPPKLLPQPLATAPVAPIDDKAAEEREAFQRVLKMLGSSGGGGVSLGGPPQPRQDEGPRRRDEQPPPPGLFGLPPPNEFSRNSREEPRPPPSGPQQPTGRPQNDEFFFRLMNQNARQAQLEQNQPQSPDRASQQQPRSNLPPGNLGILDDLSMSNFQRHFQGEQGRQDIGNERQGQQPMQRPPGLNFLPPGWPPGLPPPNPNSRQMAPPPGFGDRPGGMPPPGFFNQPFPMGPGPGGPGLPPNLPPGMPPHAFFAAMNGMPPPPGMQFGFPEGLMDSASGNSGRGSGPPGPPPGFPQFAEMQQQEGRERRQGPPPGL